MSILSVLPRLLLSIALLLNGVASAVVGVHMTLDGVPTEIVHPLPEGQAGTPCHDKAKGTSGAVASQATEHHQAGSELPAAAAAAGSPSPDCCDSVDCRYTCLEHAQFAATAAIPDVMVLPHDTDLRLAIPRHPTLQLHPLLRPPIG